MKYFFILTNIIILIGCTKSKKDIYNKDDNYLNEEFLLDSLDLQYYPAFSDPLGVCINFKKQSIRVYSLSKDYYRKRVLKKEYSTKVELIHLVRIDSIVKKISCKELESPYEYYAKDGLHLETQFYYSDGSILSNSPGNDAKPIYNTLKKNAFNLVQNNSYDDEYGAIIKGIAEYLY